MRKGGGTRLEEQVAAPSRHPEHRGPGAQVRLRDLTCDLATNLRARIVYPGTCLLQPSGLHPWLWHPCPLGGPGGVEVETRRRLAERLHIPRQRLRRHQRIDAALLDLLRGRLVLVDASVLLRVRARDFLEDVPLGARAEGDGAVDDDDLASTLDADDRPRVTRQIARPARVRAALEEQLLVHPRTPLLHQMRAPIRIG